MVNRERVIELFLNHVQIDSPTTEEYEYALELMKELKSLGFDVHMDDAGEKAGSNSGNVIGFKKGNLDKEPILFTAHMDTVSPGVGIKPVIEDGIIKSESDTILASDDKAGVVAILEGIRSIIEDEIDHPDIEVVFTIYEEGGLKGVKNIDFSQFKSKNIAVLDSSGEVGIIINQAPGQTKLYVEYTGKLSHAGVSPEKGISAIQMASDAISKMKLLRIDEDTTANIGTISGGEATNIVAEKVVIEAEARSTDDDKLRIQTQHMVDLFEEAAKNFGGKVNIEVENLYKSYKLEDNSEMILKIKSALESLDIEPILQPTGGGSDANIWNENGFSAVNIAVGMMNPHTLDEYIRIEDLINSTKLVYQIIKESK